jgi:hypothetical protein
MVKFIFAEETETTIETLHQIGNQQKKRRKEFYLTLPTKE